MKKKIEYILLIIFIIFPLVELFINSLIIQGIKSIILLSMILYLIKKKNDKKVLMFLEIYWGIYSLFLIMNKINFLEGITNLINLFYFPICLLFFINYKNEKINKIIINIIFIALLLYLLPIFNENKEIINIIIFLLPFVSIYLIEKKSQKGFILLFLILASFLLKNNLYNISTLLIGLYLLIRYRKNIIHFWKKEQLKVLLAIAAFLAAVVVYTPNINLDEVNEKIVNNYQQEFNEKRKEIQNVYTEYQKSENLEKLLGMSNKNLNSDIDILDLTCELGIIGISFYLILIIYALFKIKYNKETILTYCLVIILSIFSGKVLTSSTVVFYLAILINGGLNSNCYKNKLKYNRKK